ncbi:MAG: PAS domain-containing protein [Rhodospirillales bacterium]|jgi:PAS domain S-box-containing protein|nr:PAS domain-containing protein [Rhodospirillales bacterium]MBT4005881.1 PAS domain-containing protein [Rhodospirillales bacterium]MBT5077237.1 PAS domain-containing protein [Rhodospirillales bacterium]MBT5114166.1 PAS domain-containing protein [Rhodospirillales bacterium]MBT5672694.1 PAS domain-containing protein [Rhodospirillales bacterium]
MYKPPIFKSRVARRLILALILFSSCITLVTTGWQLLTDYRRDVAGIKTSVDLIQASYVGTITQSLWAFDDAQLGTQLYGLLAIPDIEFVEIKRAGVPHLSRGVRRSKNTVSQVLPIVFRDNTREINLGQLEIVASLDGIYRKLYEKAFVVLVGNGIKTFLVAGFLFLVFFYLVSRHLARIGTFIQEIDIGRPQTYLELDKVGPPDELDQIVDALNGMSSKIRADEERYSFAMTGTNDGVWDWNIQTGEHYWSPRWREILGYGDSELDPRVDTFSDALHPDDKDRVLMAVRDHLEKRAPYNLELRLRGKDGNYIWVQSKGQAIWGNDGKPLRMAGSISNISERKRMEDALKSSEENFRQMAENISEVFWMTDPSKNEMIYISPAYEQVWQRSCESAYENPQSFMDAIHVEDRERIRMALEKQAGGGYDEEYRIVLPDSRIRHIRDRAFPIKNEQGEVYRIVGIAGDITEHRQRDEQLQQAQKMEAVGQLTGGIAHDFNNLLAVSIGNIELAKEIAERGGDVQPFLSIILHANERGAVLTNQLLAFSRKQTLLPKSIDVGELVAGMSGLLNTALGETVVIKIVNDASLWSCEADPHQLESAVLNLALNARDAMPSGGKLTIQTRNVSLDDDYAAAQTEMAPGEYVMVAVTDTGHGMPRHVIDHAFDPFFTTKDVGKGSGLGLSMVYGFAKQSGGNVTIYSEIGEGTTIRLYFPRVMQVEKSLIQTTEENVPQSRGETILVVEDDPDVRTMSVTLLRGMGYEILEAGNGERALKLLETAPQVNLLFTDVVLPGGMNGPEIAAEVRKSFPGIAILYTSGYADLGRDEMNGLGEACELLHKPYRRAGLARKVRMVLDQAKS